jgi:anti-anti-sigma factor
MDPQTGADGEHAPSSPTPLRVVVARPRENQIRIAPDGELDLSTIELVHSALALAQPGTDVVVDLDGLTFLGSTGIQALVEADRATRSAGGTFTLVVGMENRMIRRVLAITGLDTILTVTAELADRSTNGPHA